MSEFDTLTEEHFRHLDAEGQLIIDGIPTPEDADAFRKAIRKVAREQGWRIATRYDPVLSRVWAVREDFEHQTDTHSRYAAGIISDAISGTRKENDES